MRTRRWFLPIAGVLTVAAWVALLLWQQSPYARYLDHGNWTETGFGAGLCAALPAAGWALPVALYVGGWLLMISAMMLPTVVPLLDRFDRLVSQRPDRGWLLALVIGGYMLAWFAFGMAAHLLDAVVQQAASQSDWLLFNGWIAAALVLSGAGLFQFSRLKYHCLVRCRTPLSFITKHWRGRTPLRNALLLGLDHGAFCVGCCWAIMLLMFVLGTASLGWMLLLGAVMALEKNTSWGGRLSRPLGALLLTAAGALAGVNLFA